MKAADEFSCAGSAGDPLSAGVMASEGVRAQLASHRSRFWLRGMIWALVTVGLAFVLRLMEWPCWQNPEYRLGGEWLLATHDAYHWVAGAEGIGLAVGHPMAEMLKGIAQLLGTYPAAVAFWFPMLLSTLVALIVFFWVWALGSMEAGMAAGLLTTLAPGFLARTLLGYYDTDLVTLFFPLLMTLAPACWAMRYMLLPRVLLRRLLHPSSAPVDRLGYPLRKRWMILLGLSGLVSWWSQDWHSVFLYLVRYNVGLLAFMSLVMAPRGRRALLMLGALAYALPALTGLPGLAGSALVLVVGMGRTDWALRLRSLLTRPWVLLLLWGGVAALMLGGGILETLIRHFGAYTKRAGDAAATAAGTVLVYPSVAQSITEVQDLSLMAILSYFHPWMEAALLGLVGFCWVLVRRPGALFLLPLAALGLLSTKLGGRMVMFGAPIVAVGLTLPLYWVLQRILRDSLRGAVAGLVTSAVLIGLLVAPFVGIIEAMSQGPMINRRHADALTRVRDVTPPDSKLWLWWDWGYAAHHFARRSTIADGAQHAGPWLYLPAAVFSTESPRFARQLIRYTALSGGEPDDVFRGLDGDAAQALMDKLRSPETPLVESRGKQYVVVSFEMLRLGFWISNFGRWNFRTKEGEGGAMSIVTQAMAYNLREGAVQLEGSPMPIRVASITVFDETGVTHRDYVQEWVNRNPKAGTEERDRFMASRRNIHCFFNRVTGEKLVLDNGLYQSLMVQLLLSSPGDSRISPYFKLVYDNVFARIYEVL